MEYTLVKNRILKNCIFIGIGVLLLPLFLWRAQFAIDMGDEAAYLADFNRFATGDRFLVDDWQPSMQLAVWVQRLILGHIPYQEYTIVMLRYIYVAFQFVVAGLMGFFMRKVKGGYWGSLAYLCFTPYNIFAFSYNTLAIAAMCLCISWCISREKWNAWELFLGGFFLGLSFFGIPHLIIIWIIYAVSVIIISVFKKRVSGPFSMKGVMWVTLGASFLGIVFLLSLIGKADFATYIHCIKQLFSDSEHLETGNLLTKFISSQWIVIRVYWRTFIPTIALIGYIIYNHTRFSTKGLNYNKHFILATLLFLLAIYSTIRFAFIYGSVADNLMIPTYMVLGLGLLALMYPSRNNCIVEKVSRKRYIAYLLTMLMGYLGAVCNYLASDTEILSMSAFMLPCAVVTILIAFDYCKCVSAVRQGNKTTVLRLANSISTAIYLFCILYLRMTYVFFDVDMFGQTEYISEGALTGIYTSKSNAEHYLRTNNTIRLAKPVDGERVLCIPIQPISFLAINGKCHAPYVTRFSISLEELTDYYTFFPEKTPDKIIFTEWNSDERNMNDKEIYNYYAKAGYSSVELDDGNVMLVINNGNED